MLLARQTGAAVIFEAKVLSDISAHVTFDLARNQLARTIDVMLEANPALAAPLSLRKPERTFLVLLTPALTQPGPAGDAISKSRLYGWLMPAYQDPGSSLLRQHLPHRDGSELAAAAGRLGWASWEDCKAVAPGRLPVAYSHPGCRVRCDHIRSRPSPGLFTADADEPEPISRPAMMAGSCGHDRSSR